MAGGSSVRIKSTLKSEKNELFSDFFSISITISNLCEKLSGRKENG